MITMPMLHMFTNASGIFLLRICSFDRIHSAGVPFFRCASMFDDHFLHLQSGLDPFNITPRFHIENEEHEKNMKSENSYPSVYQHTATTGTAGTAAAGTAGAGAGGIGFEKNHQVDGQYSMQLTSKHFNRNTLRSKLSPQPTHVVQAEWNHMLDAQESGIVSGPLQASNSAMCMIEKKTRTKMIIEETAESESKERALQKSDKIWLLLYTIGRSIILRRIPLTDKQEEEQQNQRPAASFQCESFPTCVALRAHAAAIGFASGDIMVFDPCNTYEGVPKHVTLNQKNCMNSSKLTTLLWVPQLENDRGNNDHNTSRNSNDSDIDVDAIDLEQNSSQEGKSFLAMTTCSSQSWLLIAGFADGSAYIYSLDYNEDHQIPPISYASPFTTRAASSSGTNPIRIFQFKSCPKCMAISTGGLLWAVGQHDGTLQLIHRSTQELYADFYSLYGALLCLDFSSDDQLLLAGGQDDMVLVCDVVNRTILARCEGHRNFVRSISFRPWQNDGIYRFVSAGEDGSVCFWEYKIRRNRHTTDTVSRNTVTALRFKHDISASGYNASKRDARVIDPIAVNDAHDRAINAMCTSMTLASKQNECNYIEVVDDEDDDVSGDARCYNIDLIVTACDDHTVHVWRRLKDSLKPPYSEEGNGAESPLASPYDTPFLQLHNDIESKTPVMGFSPASRMLFH